MHQIWTLFHHSLMHKKATALFVSLCICNNDLVRSYIHRLNLQKLKIQFWWSNIVILELYEKFPLLSILYYSPLNESLLLVFRFQKWLGRSLENKTKLSKMKKNTFHKYSKNVTFEVLFLKTDMYTTFSLSFPWIKSIQMHFYSILLYSLPLPTFYMHTWQNWYNYNCRN